MSTIKLPSVLRANANGERSIEVEGGTVGDAVQALVGRHPGLAEQLLTSPNELEVYHLDHDPTNNRVIFDALRFADNAYVFGSIDVTTGAITVTGNAGQRWQDYKSIS